MTSTHISADAAGAPTTVEASAGALAGWITSTDHKRVGRLYIATGLLVGLGALVIGVLLGLERIGPSSYSILGESSVGRLFSLYRFGLVFGGVLPVLIGVLIAVVPLQLGAREIAFPRAASLSFWMLFAGIDVMIGGYAANGGPGGASEHGVQLFVLGLGLAAAALTIASVCLVTTVLTQRTAGLTLARVPALAWSALVTGSVLLITLPVLVGKLIFLYVDDRYGRTVFGGSLGIAGNVSWAVSQPMIYCYAIPVLGLLADVAPLAGRTRREMGAVTLGGIGLVAVAAFGALVQRLTATDFKGDSTKAAGSLLFHLFTSAVPVLGILVVLGVAALTLRGARPKPTAAFVFGLTSVLLLLLGATIGVLSGFSGLKLSGTVFGIGQFELVAFAGLLAGLGSVAHWGPKLWGRRLPEVPALGLATLGFLGALLAGASDIVLGFYDQPDGTTSFATHGAMQAFNVIEAIGLIVLTVAIVGFGLLALRAFISGDHAGDDPWDGHTLEWVTSSPPPAANFAGPLALVTSAEPLLDLKGSNGKDA